MHAQQYLLFGRVARVIERLGLLRQMAGKVFAEFIAGYDLGNGG